MLVASLMPTRTTSSLNPLKSSRTGDYTETVRRVTIKARVLQLGYFPIWRQRPIGRNRPHGDHAAEVGELRGRRLREIEVVRLPQPDAHG
jgi:hypothetical protein